MSCRKLAVILGPTASGKSDLALDLAERMRLEILNCDSRQVYREMPIGTAAPVPEDRARCPHHLYELICPSENFSAGRYEVVARDCLESLWKQGRKPLLVGGTGFYFQALVEGMPDIPFVPEVREHLQQRLLKVGREALVEELRQRDPLALQMVDVNNPRRVTRALEIMEMTGRSLSAVWAERNPLQAEILILTVSWPREVLHGRISRRVASMVKSGLESEVQGLLNTYGDAAAGLKSIGYAEWLPFFRGEISREKVVEQIVIHTRQFAKRQLTWFRYQTQGIGIDLSNADSLTQLKQVLGDFWKAP